jgi:lipopolysaccharide export system protein LptA
MFCKQNNLTLNSVRAAIMYILLCSSHAIALSGNNNEPIHIKADKAELNEANGTAIYQGDVLITQGATSLSAEKIIIFSKNQALTKIEASGSPAHLKQAADEENPETEAFGNLIVYLHEQGTIEITQNAKLVQGPNQFQGNSITYNSKTRVVSASGTGQNGEKDGRVELIFHPQSAPKLKQNDSVTDNKKLATEKNGDGKEPVEQPPQ